ncbi:MAG TPA: hypothetical protein VNQ76_00970 [Planctomicrobium sp.]|nr:hypothetical protein [Planctomicrobium sp.]
MADLERRRYGKLDAHVITSNQACQAVVILCHGYGAPADDLVPVGAQLLQFFPRLLDQVEIIFPGGPLSLADQGMPKSRAWWPLDIERLTSVTNPRDFEEMRKDIPEQLPRSRTLLMELIEDALSRHQLTPDRLVLGGFSQGSMLATDVALHLPQPPGGLAIWSGALLNEADWTALAPTLKDVPVIQSHGKSDPILPFIAGTWLRYLIAGGGAQVNFIPFDGPHTIPMSAITATGELLENLLFGQEEV